MVSLVEPLEAVCATSSPLPSRSSAACACIGSVAATRSAIKPSAPGAARSFPRAIALYKKVTNGAKGGGALTLFLGGEATDACMTDARGA